MEDREEFIINFEANYNSVMRKEHGNMSFAQFVGAQEKPGPWAEDLFIKACSCLLGVPIHVTSNQSTRDNPYTIYLPWLGDLEVPAEYNHTPIILGLINGLHFQSLLHLGQPRASMTVRSLSEQSSNSTLGDWITVGKAKQRKKSSPSEKVSAPAESGQFETEKVQSVLIGELKVDKGKEECKVCHKLFINLRMHLLNKSLCQGISDVEATKVKVMKVTPKKSEKLPQFSHMKQQRQEDQKSLVGESPKLYQDAKSKPGLSSLDMEDVSSKVECKVCHRAFTHLLHHLSQKDTCREAYDYALMKEQSRKNTKGKFERDRVRDRSEWEKNRDTRDTRDRSEREKNETQEIVVSGRKNETQEIVLSGRKN
jgi:hypothetical protein